MFFKTRCNSCYRNLIMVGGILYICVMLSSFYFVATGRTRAISVDNTEELVAANLQHGEVKCVTSCNCTLFDIPWTQQVPEPPLECQRVPPGLLGRLNVNSNTTADAVYKQYVMDRLTPGGFYKPVSCRAREKVAIIIPYRNRADHLEIMLYHLHAVLQRQQLQYAIFIIELALPTQFNRGILANIGFLTAMTVENFTCAIIHDVDLLPANDRNLYRCSSKVPRHLSVSNSKYNYTLPYGHYIGGIVAFTPGQFNKINGFSNAYFGWGKEDDDLFRRILHHRYKIDRPPKDIGIYEALPHSNDRTNPDNVMKDSLLLGGEQRSRRDGLNSLHYKRLALEFRPLYTWVYVQVNETLIMQAVEFAIARIPRQRAASN